MSVLPPGRAELLRLLRTRSNWVLLLLPALVAGLRIIGAHAADRMERARRIASGAEMLIEEGQSGFGPLSDALRTGAAVLTLLLLLLGALQMVRERESGALGLSLLARSRGAVVLGKVCFLMMFTLVGFILLFAISAVVAAGLHGLGPVVDEGFEMASAAELWSETLRGCLASLPALLCAGLFGLFVSSIASSAGAAMAGTLVPFVVLDVLGGLFEGISSRLFVTYVPFLGNGSPLVHLTEIARAFSDAEWREGELLRAVSVPGFEGFVLILAAILVTRRRSA